MNIPKNQKIPTQINDDDTDSAGRPLSDDSLEALAGGETDIKDWPSCTTAEELTAEELAAVEAYNKSQQN